MSVDLWATIHGLCWQSPGSHACRVQEGGNKSNLAATIEYDSQLLSAR